MNMLPKFLMSDLDLDSFKEFKYFVKSLDLMENGQNPFVLILNDEQNEIKLNIFLYCLLTMLINLGFKY